MMLGVGFAHQFTSKDLATADWAGFTVFFQLELVPKFLSGSNSLALKNHGILSCVNYENTGLTNLRSFLFFSRGAFPIERLFAF